MTAETRSFLKPAEGRTVRQEETGALWPAEGAYAEDTLYTRRRLADGDLVAAEAPRAPKPAADGDKK
jgi:hypothetical protein